MTKTFLAAIVVAAVLAAPARAEESEKVCEALFVHNAHHIAMSENTITMTGASPTVTFFCDRPIRMAGHLSIEKYLTAVYTGKDDFVDNPPNAVVSITNGDEFVDVVVELTTMPEVEGDKLVYRDVRIIQGDVPKATGPGSLFIDIIGRPLSPMSIAGVHRRHVRRAVRRCAVGITCW